VGMYDYLGGEQVKIFYNPIFDLNKDDPLQSTTWHSGGTGSGFSYESSLPLRTFYYEYPLDFLIYDFVYDSEEASGDVWEIKNGKLVRILHHSILTEADMKGFVCTIDGTPLNINTPTECIEIKEAWKKRGEDLRRIEHEIFSGSLFTAMRKNPQEFQEKEPEWDRLSLELRKKFSKRWVKTEDYPLEKQFGEFLSCFIRLRAIRDIPPIGSVIPSENYKGCKLVLQEMIKENPKLIDNYKAWVKNEAFLVSMAFSTWLEIVLSDELPENLVS
jgi:hypothetical protein